MKFFSLLAAMACLCFSVIACADAGGGDRLVLRVDPAEEVQAQTFPTLHAAAVKAIDALKHGTPVTIRIAPGIYRETLSEIDFSEGKAAATPLTIESDPDAEGRVIWSGSDVIAAEAWRDEGGGFFSIPWPHAYGNRNVPWGPDQVIGHRSEMLFVAGRPQNQTLLELYEFDRTGQMNDHGDRSFEWKFQKSLDPKQALGPGEFGVIERGDAPRLYFRPHSPADLKNQPVEVARRAVLADFSGKQHLTLRGLTIQHARTPLDRDRPFSPLDFDRDSTDILIEDCVFQWNNNCGLRPVGQRWRIRRCKFFYNGYSGLNTAGLPGSVIEHNETSFNNWRGYRAGQIGFFIAGAKLHRSADFKITDHVAIGNMAGGVWFDIDCKNVELERITAIGNAHFGLHLELSNGPFRVRDALLAHNGQFGLHLHNLGVFDVERVLVYEASGKPWQAPVQIALRPRTDSHAKLSNVQPDRSRIAESWFIAGPKFGGPVIKDNLIMSADHPMLKNYHVTWENITLHGPREKQAVQRIINRKKTTWHSFASWSRSAGVKGGAWHKPALAAPETLDFRCRDVKGGVEYPFVKLDPTHMTRAKAFAAWVNKGGAWPNTLPVDAGDTPPVLPSRR